MADALALINRSQFEKLAGKDPKLGENHWIRRYDSKHAVLESLAEKSSSLYLVTLRPDESIWLVDALCALSKDAAGWNGPSHGATVDLTPVQHHIDALAKAPPGKLAMSLQRPRVLSKRDARLLTHAANGAYDSWSRKKIYNVKFPKWLLEDAAALDAPPAPTPPKSAAAKPRRRLTPARSSGKTKVSPSSSTQHSHRSMSYPARSSRTPASSFASPRANAARAAPSPSESEWVA